MALIVEDGSGLPNAQSFVTVEELQQTCSQRNILLIDDVTLLEGAILSAMEYIEGLEESFRGKRTNKIQSLCFPRKDVVLSDNFPIAENVIPEKIKLALCILAAEATKIDLFPVDTGRAIVEEKVGPLVTKWASPVDGGTASEQKRFTRFENVIKPFLNNATGRIKTIRV